MNWFDTRWPAILFWPLSLLYALVIDLRNMLYDLRLLRSYKISCPVVCVGNITVGGTGKTPTVQWLAHGLISRHIKVAILSRGYGRTSTGTVVVSDGRQMLASARESGDEPLLIAQSCPGAAVVVDEDRVRGARLIERLFQPDIILLDDSFQHRRLHRDFNVVTLRSSRPFGNGFCLPAGPLREPIKHLQRADLFLVIGDASFESSEIDRFQKPVFKANYQVREIYNPNVKPFDMNDLRKRSVIAVCGLAKPESFRNLLEKLNVNLLEFLTFKDHHNYSMHDIDIIEKKASTVSADFIFTTEKDWVKLREHNRFNKTWYVVGIGLNPQNGEELLSRIERLVF